MKFPQDIDFFQFSAGNKNLLLDINSMAFLEIAPPVGDLLRQAGTATRTELVKFLSLKYDENVIKEALEELELLKKYDILLDRENLSERMISSTPATDSLYCLALNLTWDSNLKCNYPYGDGGSYKTGIFMSTITAQRAIELLVENSGPRKYLSVIFRGGEPLLNFETLKYTVLYGNELASKKNKKIDYVLITNGTLLDESVIKYLNDNDIHVHVILESHRDVQKILRPSYNNNSSYDSIFKNLKALHSSRKNKAKVRSSFTGYDYDFVSIVKQFRANGFDHIKLSPISATGEERHVIKKGLLNNLEKEYMALAEYFIQEYREGNSFTFESFNNLVTDIYSSEKRHFYCGAGRTYLAVDPQGYIFPCHKFQYFDEACIGNIFKGFDENKKSVFVNNSVDTIEKCSRCWAKYLCGGGCYFENYTYNKQINRPYSQHCFLRKLEYKAALYVNSCLSETDRAIISERYQPVMIYR